MNMSKCKVCKSVKQKLFLKGKRCFTQSCAVEKMKTSLLFNRKSNRSNKPYSNQILEKRKLLSRYNIRFFELKKYFIFSKKKLLDLDSVIESRLDNLIYRSGFAPNIRTARQLVSHGFVTVNETKCNISSRLISLNDTLKISTNNAIFDLSEKPSWITVNDNEIKLIDIPKCKENFINFNLISEFLSRYV